MTNVTVSELTSRERTLLVELAEHVHFVHYRGGRPIARRRRQNVAIGLPRLNRMYQLGVVRLDHVEGMQAVVLTPLGRRLLGEVLDRRRARRRPAAALPLKPWWLE